MVGFLKKLGWGIAGILWAYTFAWMTVHAIQTGETYGRFGRKSGILLWIDVGLYALFAVSPVIYLYLEHRKREMQDEGSD